MNLRFFRSIGATLVFFLLTAGCVSSTTGSSETVSPIVIPMSDYVAGLKTIDVEMGGETHAFLVDTAGGKTVITPEVAKGIGCIPFGNVTGFRHSGEAISGRRCAPHPIKVGSFRNDDEESMVFDLMSLLRGAPEIGGIIGLPLFEPEIVTFDYIHDQIVIENGESFAARISEMQEVRIRPSRQAGGASLDLMIAIDSSPGPLWFELDSGNTGPVILAPHTAEILGVGFEGDETRQVELPVSGIGTITVDARLKSPLIYDGLLNTSFFRTHLVTVDLGSMRAWVSAD